MGPAIIVLFWVRQLFDLCGHGWRCMTLAENSWRGLLAWFLTQVRLKNGLCSYLDSLVRLLDGQDLVQYSVVDGAVN